MPILAPLIAPFTEPLADADLENWARLFILSPTASDQERHERHIVAQLLADVEASR